MMSHHTRLVVFTIFLSFCLSAQADAIFSNITENSSTSNASICGSPNMGCGFGLIGGGFTEAAVAFTPTTDYTLSDVEVFVFNAMLGGLDNAFEVYLYSDSAGLPGTEIAGSGGYAQTQRAAIETLTMGAVELTAGTQ
jgi:hypothetical protein